MLTRTAVIGTVIKIIPRMTKNILSLILLPYIWVDNLQWFSSAPNTGCLEAMNQISNHVTRFLIRNMSIRNNEAEIRQKLRNI